MGALSGYKVIEIAGIGPGPFCAMMLADHGAEVLRVDRKGTRPSSRIDVLNRGRRSIALDLKNPQAVQCILRLVRQADALIEGFRPGVMERLGLGPETCFEHNRRLVYGRMTGWGQSGPLAQAAGHDINYIALSGALHAIGREGTGPVPPLNLVGDFGGGGMMLAYGVVCALLEAQRSGQGQVVDAAMTDGSAVLMAAIFGLYSSGFWTSERGVNLLDTGAHFYDTYECADGKHVAIGSIEPQFYALLLEKTGLLETPQGSPSADLPTQQMNRGRWPEFRLRLAEVFRTKTRAEWCSIMEGSDVCFAPVLDFAEAAAHPHNRARETFLELEGALQPAPAPRLSRTPPATTGRPPSPGEHNREALAAWGFSAPEVEQLFASGAL